MSFGYLIALARAGVLGSVASSQSAKWTREYQERMEARRTAHAENIRCLNRILRGMNTGVVIEIDAEVIEERTDLDSK